MKIVIFVGLIMLPSLLFGQLRGTYCHEFGSGKTYINFSKNRFCYYSYCCTGASKGKGRFEIKNDSLFLKFEKLKVSTHQNKVKIREVKNNSDTALLIFSINDFKTGEHIENYAICLMDSKNKIIAGKVSDSNGNCVIAYPRSIDSVSISVAGLPFYRKFSTKLILNNNYIIEIKLVSDYLNHHYESWESYGVKIKNIDKNSFELQDKYQQSFAFYQKYTDVQFPKWWNKLN